MEHTQYGELVDTGIDFGDGGTHGIVKLEGAISLTDFSVLPSRLIFTGETPDAVGSSEGEFLVVSLAGSVIKGQETVGACWIVPWMDVGRLAAMLTLASRRAEGGLPQNDFEVGFDQAMRESDDTSDSKSGD